MNVTSLDIRSQISNAHCGHKKSVTLPGSGESHPELTRTLLLLSSSLDFEISEILSSFYFLTLTGTPSDDSFLR